jgi:uncharacterized protein (TIRG00374 family)
MTNDSRSSASTFDAFSGRVDRSSEPADIPDETNLDDPEFERQEEEVASESIWKRILDPRTLISFLVAIVIMAFVVWKGDLDIRKSWQSIRNANVGWYAFGLAVFYFSFVIRAVRWRAMLARAGVTEEHGYQIPALRGFLQILLISWFANCVVPAKLGDAFRGYLLKERSQVSFGLSMGTILAERLMDLVILVGVLLLSGLIVFGTHIPRDAELAFALGAATVAVGVIGAIGLFVFRSRVERILPERFAKHFTKLTTGVFHSLRNPLPLIGYTVSIWLLDGVRLWMVAKSLGIDLHVVESQMVSLSSALVTIIPFTPGGLGVVEAFMVWILQQVDVLKDDATAIAVLDRSISYFSLIVVGIPLYVWYLRHKVVKAVKA